MASILVVDDSTVDRRLAGRLLEKQPDLSVTYAKDGKAAVKAIDKEAPDLVLTDLNMPQMNGLELVEHIRTHHPLIPVILMTAQGSDEIAVEALQKGAASYVPKRLLAEELARTVENVLDMARSKREQHRLLDSWTQTESRFVLENDTTLIPPLIGHVVAGLKRLALCDATGLIRVTVALGEAVQHAMERGNLELGSTAPHDKDARRRIAAERREQDPYRARHVHVVTRETRDEAVFVVRHEGPGLDAASLPDAMDPANLDQVSARGLILIRMFMDDVYDSDDGREITMTKRRDAPRPVSA